MSPEDDPSLESTICLLQWVCVDIGHIWYLCQPFFKANCSCIGPVAIYVVPRLHDQPSCRGESADVISRNCCRFESSLARFHPPQAYAMPTSPHVCPVLEVTLAAQTITSVLNHNNPFISFLYSNHTPPPLVPYGKPEQLSVYLYRTLTTGLVLTVDDGDQKCVGVAIWQGPASETSLFGRLRDWCVHTSFDIWDTLNSIYYGRSGIDETVLNSYFQLTEESSSLRTSFKTIAKGNFR